MMRSDDQADDRLLIARVAQHDAAALEQLYIRCRPRLWRYLWQQLEGDSSAVEDALQEIFLAVWRGAGDFRGAAKVNTWIFRIAHHQLAHYQRAIARRPEGHMAAPGPLDEEEAPWNGVWNAIAQDSHESAVLDRMILARAFGRLAAKHREALELVYQQGFTLDEVAQTLDVPLGTVKSRISYARRALQRELARSTEEEAPC
jgi:RNA polymerase sigma-70 factor, ECF subfamily